MCSEKMFKEVFERQFNRVYRVAYLLLKDIDKTEDVVQMIFLDFFNSNMRFIDDVHEKTWFITVTRNMCQDVINKEQKIRIGIRRSQDQQVNRNGEYLLDVIMELPSKYREILYLFCYEGYQVKDMAKYFNLKENEIFSRLKIAKKLLKIMLEGER